MRYSIILPAFFLLSCTQGKIDLKENEETFLKRAKLFHELYVTAGDCDQRNGMIDKNIAFFENGQPFTYDDIVEYCSYIKPKDVVSIYSKQYLIEPLVGFDYTDQYYVNSQRDTLRETTSRIWQFKSEDWVVTHMEVSRQAK